MLRDGRPDTEKVVHDVATAWITDGKIGDAKTFRHLGVWLPTNQALRQLSLDTLDGIVANQRDKKEKDWTELDQWNDIWQPLLAAWPTVDVINRGYSFLTAADESHRSWRRVWASLLSVGQNTERLVELALQWLTSQQEKDKEHSQTITPVVAWSTAWLSAWDYVKRLPTTDANSPGIAEVQQQLVNLAEPWLRTAERHRATYGKVLARVLQYQPLSPWRDWAAGLVTDLSPITDSWNIIWRSVYDLATPPEQAELLTPLREAHEQLPMGATAWPYVWAEMWATEAVSREALVERGRQWLAHAYPRRRGWSIVWRQIAKELQFPPDLLEQGYTWLRRARPTRRSWAPIWRAIGQVPTGRTDDWQVLGENWLTQQSQSDTEWPKVLATLLESGRRSRVVRVLAQTWLTARPTDPIRRPIEQALQSLGTEASLSNPPHVEG